MTFSVDTLDHAAPPTVERSLPNRPLTADELSLLYTHDRVEDIRVGAAWESVDPRIHGEFDAFGVVHLRWMAAWVRNPSGWVRLVTLSGRDPDRLVATVAEYEAGQQAFIDAGIAAAHQEDRR